MTFIEANVLKVNDRIVIEEHHDRLIEYLKQHHPLGFKQDVEIYVNETKIDLVDYDMILNKYDVIVLLYRPAVAAALGITNVVAAFIVNMLAAAAISYVIGQIFKPKIPKNQSTLSSRNARGQASSVYSLNSQQNEAKRGQPIPIVYGRVRLYPALIAPPYYRYENNEEYLYQLMCVGHGKFNIEQMLISDTDTQTISPDYFKYEKLEYDDFKYIGGINAAVNDDNYHEVVKTITDVDNLEIRGTPERKAMTMRFDGNTIEFFPYADGTEVDLSSLSSGSSITIDNTIDNDGIYTVNSVLGNKVTVDAHTFVTEPIDTKVYNLYDNEYNKLSFHANSSKFWLDYEVIPEDIFLTNHIHDAKRLNVGVGNIFSIPSTSNDRNFQAITEKDSYYLGDGGTYTDVQPSNFSQSTGSVTLLYHAKVYNATFETSYGAYSYNKPHIGFEVDYIYPNGIYNTDSNGKFTERPTSFEIRHTGVTLKQDDVITTVSDDNTTIRKTFKYMYGVTRNSESITIKRTTPEPTGIDSSDKLYIKSVKFIHDKQNNEPFGDITLIWCKVRASNAITSIGQFSINAWLSRSDKNNSVSSVLSDLYTNSIYGGRLPYTDLDFQETQKLVNGAIDSQMTLYDALQTVAKSNRYNVYPVGGQLKLKYDTKKPIRTALYNETNILKDTLKISYLFTEKDEHDSVKVMYRSPIDFSEQYAIYPTDGIFPDEIELWGITDEQAAVDTATYLFLQDRSRRKTVEFKTDIQGLIPEYLDKIAISHNIPQWGLGGQILAIDGNKLTLDCDFDIESGTIDCDATIDCDDIFCTVLDYDTIIFRNNDGSVSATYLFTVISAREILLDVAPPAWLYVGFDYDNTFFSIGNSLTILRDYIVIKVEPDGNNDMKITAANYDDSIYDYPSGNILTEDGKALLTESGDNLIHEG